MQECRAGMPGRNAGTGALGGRRRRAAGAAGGLCRRLPGTARHGRLTPAPPAACGVVPSSPACLQGPAKASTVPLRPPSVRDTCKPQGITESFMLEKTSKIIQLLSRHCQGHRLNHVPQCHIYVSFKHLRGWGLHYFPEQPALMHGHPFHAEVFQNTQSKPHWCPITSCFSGDTGPHLAPPSF